ncbi:MAG: LPS export ABC transporter periplasmic protein LptC [Desulfobacterales bacterium]|nr:LPS export ABC transporter periplasmic protein LptC [Desulfobacterales bacterium]
MASVYKKPTLIKIILAATIVIILGTVIAIYIISQSDPYVMEPVAESAEPEATLSVNKIHQTATRDGKKEWSLEASSGHFIDKTRQLILKDVKVTFFLKDKSEILLLADQGILETDSSNIEVTGNVVLDNKEYKLLTEKLSYDHNQRLLYSKTPVTISGASAKLAAESLRFDIDTKKLTLEGRVATQIDEDFAL